MHTMKSFDLNGNFGQMRKNNKMSIAAKDAAI
jgi:hypothetical protein